MLRLFVFLGVLKVSLCAVISPSADTVWVRGDSHRNVLWETNLFGGEDVRVRIGLTRTADPLFSRVLSYGVNNTGSFPYGPIPLDLPTGGDFVLAVTSENAPDTRADSAPFRIRGPLPVGSTEESVLSVSLSSVNLLEGVEGSKPKLCVTLKYGGNDPAVVCSVPYGAHTEGGSIPPISLFSADFLPNTLTITITMDGAELAVGVVDVGGYKTNPGPAAVPLQPSGVLYGSFSFSPVVRLEDGNGLSTVSPPFLCAKGSISAVKWTAAQFPTPKVLVGLLYGEGGDIIQQTAPVTNKGSFLMTMPFYGEGSGGYFVRVTSVGDVGSTVPAEFTAAIARTIPFTLIEPYPRAEVMGREFGFVLTETRLSFRFDGGEYVDSSGSPGAVSSVRVLFQLSTGDTQILQFTTGDISLDTEDGNTQITVAENGQVISLYDNGALLGGGDIPMDKRFTDFIYVQVECVVTAESGEVIATPTVATGAIEIGQYRAAPYVGVESAEEISLVAGSEEENTGSLFLSITRTPLAEVQTEGKDESLSFSPGSQLDVVWLGELLEKAAATANGGEQIFDTVHIRLVSEVSPDWGRDIGTTANSGYYKYILPKDLYDADGYRLTVELTAGPIRSSVSTQTFQTKGGLPPPGPEETESAEGSKGGGGDSSSPSSPLWIVLLSVSLGLAVVALSLAGVYFRVLRSKRAGTVGGGENPSAEGVGLTSPPPGRWEQLT